LSKIFIEHLINYRAHDAKMSQAKRVLFIFANFFMIVFIKEAAYLKNVF